MATSGNLMLSLVQLLTGHLCFLPLFSSFSRYLLTVPLSYTCPHLLLVTLTPDGVILEAAVSEKTIEVRLVFGGVPDFDDDDIDGVGEVRQGLAEISSSSTS